MNRKQRRAAQNAEKIAAKKQLRQAAANGGDLFERGVACHEQGQLDEAATLYRQLLDTDPQHAEGWYHLGGVAYQLGQWPEAAEHLRKALDLKSDYAEAHNVLGVALKNLGLLDDAFEHLSQAINLQPRFPDALCNLGNVFMQMERYTDAEKQYRLAIAINPGFVLALSNLGATLLRLRRWDEAVTILKQAIALAPNHAESHNNLGVAFLEQGHADQAIECYQKAIEIFPKFADAHNNLGNAFVSRQRHTEAIEHFMQAISLGFNNAKVRTNLGVALHELERYDEAIEQYRQALVVDPSYAAAYNNIGNTLNLQGEPDEAIAFYQKALEHDPNYAEAYNNIGVIHSEQGRIDQSLDSFQKTIAVNPKYTQAYRNISSFHKYSKKDEYATLLLCQAAEIDSLTDEEKIHLHYALGKFHQDTGDYDQAFTHFDAGAALKRKSIDFNPDAIDAAFNNVVQFFESSPLNKIQPYGDSSELPVFILGMPRSGTTLVEQILTSHPNVHGAGEIKEFDNSLQGFRANKNMWSPASNEAMDLAKRGGHYVQALQSLNSTAQRITDKMPFNFMNIGMIHLALPHATIIHCRRDPIDTCLSNFFTFFSEPIDWSYDLSEIGRFYVAYAHIMDRWHHMLPGRILDVQYEDVVADLEGQSRRIVDHCNLPWNDACLEFQKAKRTVRTASSGQVRKPIYTSSVQRWRRYEDHLGPLLKALEPILGEEKAA